MNKEIKEQLLTELTEFQKTLLYQTFVEHWSIQHNLAVRTVVEGKTPGIIDATFLQREQNIGAARESLAASKYFEELLLDLTDEEIPE